jgi:hypothetical protein
MIWNLLVMSFCISSVEGKFFIFFEQHIYANAHITLKFYCQGHQSVDLCDTEVIELDVQLHLC